MKTAELDRALQAGLKVLRMPAIRNCYKEMADQARRESKSFERFLSELVTHEQQTRHTNRIQRWLRDSRLPLYKHLIPLTADGCRT